MPFPEDLLEQAQHLVHRDPTRPRQASLRRAVSTAYYALFHLLIAEATRNWKHAPSRNAFGRVFEHGRMKAASDSWRRTLSKSLPLDSSGRRQPSIERRLLRVADTFIEMQHYRHAADYDNSRRWTRAEAVASVNEASVAFKYWKSIRKTAPAQAYLASLLIKDRA